MLHDFIMESLFSVIAQVMLSSQIAHAQGNHPNFVSLCQSMTLHIELCTFPMHLRSSSAYSDTLHIGLHMLCNSAPPPASMPLHMPPPLVCLFTFVTSACVACLFVCFPLWIVSIN